MKISMTQSEIRLLESFLRCSNHYVEFGAGGSTYLAASLVKKSVFSVDSSQDWLSKVQTACEEGETPIKPELFHVDIGPIGDWGGPIGNEHKSKWPNYYSAIWENPKCCRADLCLIDGRFRVASFIQALCYTKKNTIIAIHDFAIRPNYHIVQEISREIARVENLSFFIRANDFDRERAAAILKQHEYNPA